jgi:plastocyanin
MTPMLRIAALCALTVVVAGCSTSTPEISAPPSTAALAPAGPRITISALNYGDPLLVRPGVQVTVVNEDDVAHTVTSKLKGKFDARVAAHGWTTFTAPTEPAEYRYFCIYHPAMLGTLMVQ